MKRIEIFSLLVLFLAPANIYLLQFTSKPSPLAVYQEALPQVKATSFFQDSLEKVKSLSIQEKISQTLICDYPKNQEETATDGSKYCGNYFISGKDIVQNGLEGIEEINRLLHEQNPQTLIMIDQEGGRTTRINDGSPSPQEMAMTNTASYWGKFHGELLLNLGIDVNLAPVADIGHKSPAIGSRSFGEDPVIVSEFIIQYLQSLQEMGVLAVVKHLPGHGRVPQDTHIKKGILDYPWEEIMSYDLLPFVAAVNAGAKILMVGHIIIPEIDTIPASISQNTISKLRQFLPNGNQLIFITDSLSMKGTGLPPATAAIEALKAGEDMLIINGLSEQEIFSKIADAYTTGYLDIDALDHSVAKIQNLKAQMSRFK